MLSVQTTRILFTADAVGRACICASPLRLHDQDRLLRKVLAFRSDIADPGTRGHADGVLAPDGETCLFIVE